MRLFHDSGAKRVFTSSGAPKDRQRAAELKANEYLVKPLWPAELKSLLLGVEEQWLRPLLRKRYGD